MIAWAELREKGTLIVEPVTPTVLRLSESVVNIVERAYFYLLIGKDEDCLIDGGWGLIDGLDALRDPAKPLLAIATHSHVDHLGLLHLAERRFGHAAEAAVYADATPAATQALPYLAGLPFTMDGGVVDPASVTQTACPLTGTIDEGDTISVAGRRLEVLHTPGHSPGSICLLDREAGLLFCADTVYEGQLLDDLAGSDPQAMLMSHRRLAGVDFMTALPGHGGILDRPAFLARIRRHAQDRGAASPI